MTYLLYLVILVQYFANASSVPLIHEVCDTAIDDLVELQQACMIADSNIEENETKNTLERLSRMVGQSLEKIEFLCKARKMKARPSTIFPSKSARRRPNQ